jgi:hypothetical protein
MMLTRHLTLLLASGLLVILAVIPAGLLLGHGGPPPIS